MESCGSSLTRGCPPGGHPSCFHRGGRLFIQRLAVLMWQPAPGLVSSHRWEAFDTASLMIRRRVIDALLDVRLKPGKRGSKTFDPDSVILTWKET